VGLIDCVSTVAEQTAERRGANRLAQGAQVSSPDIDGGQAPKERVRPANKEFFTCPIGRPPDLEELARVLQTSTRSLRRSLQVMGGSYLELLDESRRVRAEEWVRATQMTFEQIAEAWVSATCAASGAFKRWTGITPSDFRGGAEPEPLLESSTRSAQEPRTGAAAGRAASVK
jgi:transcriptional regulator GlxA family with amidase domain